MCVSVWVCVGVYERDSFQVRPLFREMFTARNPR